VEGFRVYAVRPDSVFGKLGIANGDTVVAVRDAGGDLLGAPTRDALARIRAATKLEVEIARGGRTLTLTYVLR